MLHARGRVLEVGDAEPAVLIGSEPFAGPGQVAVGIEIDVEHVVVIRVGLALVEDHPDAGLGFRSERRHAVQRPLRGVGRLLANGAVDLRQVGQVGGRGVTQAQDEWDEGGESFPDR